MSGKYGAGVSSSAHTSSMTNHALASGLIGESEIREHQQLLSQLVEEQVRTALKKAMADVDQSTRKEIDMLRRECDTLRRDIEATQQQVTSLISSGYRSNAPPVSTMQMMQMPSSAQMDLKTMPDYQKLEKRVRSIETVFAEWQVKERLSFVAVGMLALQAGKLEDAEKDASMSMLEEEERSLTSYLNKHSSAGPIYAAGSSQVPPALTPTSSSQIFSAVGPGAHSIGSASGLGSARSPTPSGDWWKTKLGNRSTNI